MLGELSTSEVSGCSQSDRREQEILTNPADDSRNDERFNGSGGKCVEELGNGDIE